MVSFPDLNLIGTTVFLFIFEPYFFDLLLCLLSIYIRKMITLALGPFIVKLRAAVG